MEHALRCGKHQALLCSELGFHLLHTQGPRLIWYVIWYVGLRPGAHSTKISLRLKKRNHHGFTLAR